MSSSHPKGLYLLFFTELWERFGFYTLQAIIVLYMTKSLLFDDHKTYLLYGAFSALVYLTPVLGGYLADKFIGFKQSILIGGGLFIFGYAMTALPMKSAFFIGLSAVVIANGFFKPSVSSLVGELYQPDDPRRDGGFMIFYMGINIGSLIPPLIIGAIVNVFGWHWGFLLAAIGMVCGMIIFLMGRKRLSAGGIPAESPLIADPGWKKIFYFLLFAGILVAIFLVHLVFFIPSKADIVLILCSVFILAAIISFLMKEKPPERSRMTACLILILIAVAFWALYCQTFTSFMLFADRNMVKEMLGIPINAEFTQFFNPFFIVILSPLLSPLWVWLDRRNCNPSTPLKFSLAMLLVAIGFLFLSGMTALFSPGGFLSPWYLVINYLFMTIGELLLSPIGLSMITRLAPRRLKGMMMGVWFLMQSAGFAIGSMLSTLTDMPKETPPGVSIGIYSHAFSIFGSIAMALAVVSFLLVPYLKKLINTPASL